MIETMAQPMRGLRSLSMLVFCLRIVPGLHAQTKKLATARARDHVGDRTTVCGKVVSSQHAMSSKGEATFLNLDEPYPREIFTILIWGSDREKFGAPEDQYKGLLMSELLNI
jgi:micrococcal nuclease